MNNFYDQLCDSFIRPSRQIYNSYDLGQPIGQNWKRYDFSVFNTKQNKIMCSYFSNTQNSLAPCVVYLHSLNGSRLQSISYMQQVINKGFNFCCFDFSGTGLSQGKYVSLGFFQKFDIIAVLQYVSNKFGIKNFVLWGRSMGAAAAIKFMSMIGSSSKNLKNLDYQIESLILDSPFYSLSQITLQLAKQKVSMPDILIKAVLMMVQSNIQQKAGFKISQMQLLEDIKLIKCPVLLLTSKQDKLVNSKQSQKIYETINHRDRQIVFIKGQHNSCRDTQTIQTILNFVSVNLNKKKIGKQILAKSTKLLNYRVKNNLVVSSAITSKSSKKLQNSSLQMRFETCEDEEFKSTLWDEEVEQKMTNAKKPSKISLQLYSPKINREEHNKNKNPVPIQKVAHNIVLMRVQNSGQPPPSPPSYFQKKFNTNQKQKIIQQNIQHQSQKKTVNVESIHKNCMQINRSPIKEPPKVSVKQKKQNNLPSVLKTPEKKTINYILDQDSSSKEQQRSMNDKKTQKVQTNVRLSLSDQQNLEGQTCIEVNHFNIINDKLKKKRKKQQRNPSPNFNIQNNPSFIRNISVSIQRKSQLSVKCPPELTKKNFQNVN